MDPGALQRGGAGVGETFLTICLLFWWSTAFLFGSQLINAAIDLYADSDPDTANLSLHLILITLCSLYALLVRDALIHHFTITKEAHHD